LDDFKGEVLSSLGLLVDLLQVSVCDGDVFVVVEIERDSFFSADLDSRSLKFVAVPLFQ
jgi:hypothetical protein